MTRTALPIVAIFCTLLLAGVMIAGPLTPPAGPVADSGRFGTQIELSQTNTPGDRDALFIITDPGSYILTNNADAGVLKGIEILADNVTIDLNGYSLSGTGLAGISAGQIAPGNNSFNGVRVTNGVIDGFRAGFDTTNLITSTGGGNILDVRLDQLRVTNAELGIRASGQSTIESCTVNASQIGIIIDTGSARACAVVMTGDNTFDSIGFFTRNATLNDCVCELLFGNTANAQAFQLDRSVARGCAASGLGIGFRLATDSLAIGCHADNVVNDVVFAGGQAIDCNF